MVPTHRQIEHEKTVLERCFQPGKAPPEAYVALLKMRRTVERLGLQRMDAPLIALVAQPFLPDVEPEPAPRPPRARAEKPEKPIVVKGALDGKNSLTAAPV